MSEPSDAAKQWKSRETTTGPEVLINGEWITPFTSKLVREHNRMLAELTRDKAQWEATRNELQGIIATNSRTIAALTRDKEILIKQSAKGDLSLQ